jgi:ferredoxin
MIAPETFTLQGRRAEIISQKQVTDNKTQQAIRKCPEGAIEIIEV